jgi:hypothetical protein
MDSTWGQAWTSPYQCRRRRAAVVAGDCKDAEQLRVRAIECISALFEEVLVVGLFYDRERRDQLRWYHVSACRPTAARVT